VSNVSADYKLYVENSTGENKFGVQLSSNSIILYNDKDDDSFSADKDQKLDSVSESLLSLIKDSVPMILTLIAFQMVGLITVFFIG
jgi:hypothetical protein